MTIFSSRLEVTLIDQGVGRNNENHIITQSSLKEENLFDHYGSSIEVFHPQTTFFFFRPFQNHWTSFIARATSTVYQTVTSTFLTTSFVESTVSTSTLLIKCENSTISEILLKRLPKCQQEPSTESSTTKPGNSTSKTNTV